MQIAVLGSTGSLGSHVCVELLRRGHDVVGISRSPEKLGEHEKYRSIPLDIGKARAQDFMKVLENVDVLVWAYNPQMSPDVYKSYIETVRRILQAVKTLNKTTQRPYFIMVGGTGSLELPNQPFDTVLDHRDWWLTLRRMVADSEAATVQMVERVGGSGPIAESVRAYRTARKAIKEDKMTEEHLEAIKQNEDPILHGENPFPDVPLAARAAFMMFEGNDSFKWTFLSPPAGFRPGVKSGKYEVWFDTLPISPTKPQGGESQDESDIGSRLLGIAVPDLALAVVDEAEKQEKIGKHWTAVGDLGNDEVVESSVRI